MSVETTNVVVANDINYDTYNIAVKTNTLIVVLVFGVFAFSIFKFLKNALRR